MTLRVLKAVFVCFYKENTITEMISYMKHECCRIFSYIDTHAKSEGTKIHLKAQEKNLLIYFEHLCKSVSELTPSSACTRCLLFTRRGIRAWTLATDFSSLCLSSKSLQASSNRTRSSFSCAPRKAWLARSYTLRASSMLPPSPDTADISNCA